MNKLALAICIAVTLVFISGCQAEQEQAPQQKSRTEPLVIGLIPEHNLFMQLERYEPMARYLSEKLQTEVKLKVLPRYGNIIDNFVSTGLDGAFFGSFTYALAHRKLELEVLARPESLEGRSTYYGMILVRKDSGIQDVADFKGKRFAFVDQATTAGYLLPLAYFKEHDIAQYRKYLGETYFTGTHEDAIYDVLSGKADIAAAKNTVYERIALENKAVVEELRVLAVSPDVPENALAVRKDLDVSLKERLKEALLAMHEDPEGQRLLQEFGARRFIETFDRDYEPVYAYVKQAGLDLATYDYIND